MVREVEITAASVEEAISDALEQLDATKDDVDIEVIKDVEKKIFGGSSNAVVKVSLKEKPTEQPMITSNGEDEVMEEEPIEDNNHDDMGGDSEDEKNYNESMKELSEEELDQVADATIETLRSILGYFGAGDADIDEYEGEDGELIMDIVGENLALLIGRYGKTLDSLQFIVSTIVSNKIGFRYPIVIDIEGYKQRKKQKIVTLAKSSAARAIRQKHEIHLRPMNPYERRIIHIALREDRRVTTQSEGSDIDRHIVIIPN